MSALFGSSSAQPRSKNLVEFKAGKMTLNGKLVKPDKRKGLVYVYQSEDSIMHFCWKDRNTGIVEDDLMIFPDDIEYKRITQCTTGRVFLMKFKSSNKKFFFWMQEPDAEKDEKLWKKLNDFLNNPPPPGSGGSMSGERGSSSSSAAGLASAFGAEFGGTDLQSLLSSMNEQQIQQLLGMSGYIPVNSPTSNRSVSSNASSNQNSRAQSTTSTSRANASATPTATTTSTTTTTTSSSTTTTTAAATTTTAATPAAPKPTDSASQRIQLSDLQNILGSLNTGENQQASVDLSEIVSAEVMAPILSNKQIQEKLMKYLPEGDVLPKTEDELKNTFSTPQFKRAMTSFGEALQSGQLGPLMQQFNLPAEVTTAAAQGNLEEFAKAMEAHMKKLKEGKSSEGADDESKMDT